MRTLFNEIKPSKGFSKVGREKDDDEAVKIPSKITIMVRFCINNIASQSLILFSTVSLMFLRFTFIYEGFRVHF